MVRYVQLPKGAVDTALLEDAARRGKSFFHSRLDRTKELNIWHTWYGFRELKSGQTVDSAGVFMTGGGFVFFAAIIFLHPPSHCQYQVKAVVDFHLL